MADRRRLHIGVDGRELAGQPTGVGRYIGEVLRQWTSDPSWPHALTIFSPAPPPDALAKTLDARVSWSIVPTRHGGTWWEQWHLPRALGAAGCDVLFAGAYTAPVLCPCPFVVVIHDVSFAAHPEWFSPRERTRRQWLTWWAARRSCRIVAVSEFSAKEIVRVFGVPRDRILIAGGGPPSSPGKPAHGSDVHALPTVLYVGSLFNRRLIPELIAGFARAARVVPSARLVLVGDNRTRPVIDPRDVAAREGVADRVEWRAYLTDEELEHLYAGARVFAFLSTYEGFALTPLEAIAHDVPAVLLDTEIAREIYGAGARLVRRAPDAIADALVTLLTDEEAHRRQREAGREVLARHSWTRTATRVREALEDAASHQP